METQRPDAGRISHLKHEAERARRIARQLSLNEYRQRLERYAEELEREAARIEHRAD